MYPFILNAFPGNYLVAVSNGTVQVQRPIPAGGNLPTDLEPTDFLDPEDDLNNLVSGVSQGLRPDPGPALITQLVPSDPLNTANFPTANDLLFNTNDRINEIFSPTFGSNVQVPVDFLNTPIPIPDLGVNPEPLKIIAVANAAPISPVNRGVGTLPFEAIFQQFPGPLNGFGVEFTGSTLQQPVRVLRPQQPTLPVFLNPPQPPPPLTPLFLNPPVGTNPSGILNPMVSASSASQNAMALSVATFREALRANPFI